MRAAAATRVRARAKLTIYLHCACVPIKGSDVRSNIGDGLDDGILGFWSFFPFGEAGGAEYRVGPAREYKSLQDVTGMLTAGDVVTVDGGVSYLGGYRWMRTGARRWGDLPCGGRALGGMAADAIGGGDGDAGQGEPLLIEALIYGGTDPGTTRVFYNVGDDLTLRDCVVHDVHARGSRARMRRIADAGSRGGVWMREGLYGAPIYVGSDVTRYPKAVFEMRYCYVHDGNRGNNVKSR